MKRSKRRTRVKIEYSKPYIFDSGVFVFSKVNNEYVRLIEYGYDQDNFHIRDIFESTRRGIEKWADDALNVLIKL